MVRALQKYLSSSLSLIICSAFIVLILFPLFQHGLFTDGYLYKGVAINYAKSLSGFWNMKFTNINMPQFVEQPPFFFFLNGLWFKAFGTSHIADKLFTAVLLVINGVFIYHISKLFFKTTAFYFFWVLLFQLLLVQVWNWTFVNQVIESLVIPLSLAGAFLFFKWHKQSTTHFSTILYALGFSIICLLLFLTKGFQSVFIAVIPAFAMLLFKKKKSLLVFALVSYISIAAMLYHALFISAGGKAWFDAYLQKRLLASLNQVGATAEHHYEIIIRTLTELLGVFILIFLGIVFIQRQKKYAIKRLFQKNKYALLCLITALFGSLPFAITLEQRGFYLSPSFFFFILAATLFSKRLWLLMVIWFTKWHQNNTFKWGARGLFLISALLLCVAPLTYKQQEVMLHDVKALGNVLQPGDTLSINENMWNHVSLHSELFMRYQVSLECGDKHKYYLEDTEYVTEVPKGYQKIVTKTKQFWLYKKQ
jgi:hypothetical protein